MNRLLTAAVLMMAAVTAHADTPLPSSTPGDEKIDPAQLERMHDLVSAYVTDGKYAGTATMLVRNGKIVDWQFWGKANIDTEATIKRDTIYRIYSLTKVITSVAALQLIEKGELSLSQPITDFIPELDSLRVYVDGPIDSMDLIDIERPITVGMLLNHTAGFSYGFFNETPVHELYNRAGLWDSDSYDAFLERVLELPLVAQPGTDFNYGISDDILAIIVQRASGMSFERYIEENITVPLRMHDTGFHVPDEKMHRLASIHRRGTDGGLGIVVDDVLGAYTEEGRGIPSGGGGLFSTMGDFARFVQCLLDGGTLDGAKILSREMLESAMRDTLRDDDFAFTPEQGWGLIGGLYRNSTDSHTPASDGTLTWSGAATTYFFADPTENLIAMVFAQHFPYDEHKLFEKFRTSVYRSLE